MGGNLGALTAVALGIIAGTTIARMLSLHTVLANVGR